VVKFRQGCRSLQLSRFFAIGLRVAPSFAEVRSWFCKAWHSFTIPHVLRLTRQVSGHGFSRAISHLKKKPSLRRRPRGPRHARFSRGGVEIRAQLLPASKGSQHARFSRVGIGARFLARRDAMQRSARKNSMPWCGTRPYKKPPTVGAMGNASKAVVGICRGNGKFARCHAKHYGRGCPSLFNPGHLQLRL
jgi:hypothetical protein